MRTDMDSADISVLILDYSVDRSESPLFSRWFPEGTGHFTSYVHFQDPIPDPGDFSCVMHTGSSLSICEDAPFLKDASQVIRECVHRGIPQMGVCYGHQLLCRCLLGPNAVGKCPNGFEVGWKEVRMKGRGLEIPGVQPVITVLQSHFDRIQKLPHTSEIIAWNDHTEVQAFMDVETRLFGVQFHPEFEREDGNSLFIKERELLLKHGADPEIITRSGPSIDAGRVFFDYFLSYSW